MSPGCSSVWLWLPRPGNGSLPPGVELPALSVLRQSKRNIRDASRLRGALAHSLPDRRFLDVSCRREQMILHTASCKPGLGPRKPGRGTSSRFDTWAPVTYAKTLFRNLSTMVGLSSFVVAWLATCGEPPCNKASASASASACGCVCVCVCVCLSACACASVRVGCSCRGCCSGTSRCAFIHGALIATAEWRRAPPLRGRRRACVLVQVGARGRVGGWADARLRTRARFRLQSSVGVSRSTYESKERTLLGRSAREVASHLCRRSVSRTTDNRRESDE